MQYNEVEQGGVHMYKSKFSSNAEELRYFAELLLEDGQEHSVQEIKDFVKCHSEHSEDFTIGMYSGALRSLVQNSNGKYAIVKRGKYQLINAREVVKEESDLKNKIINILDSFCGQLQEACTVNIMNVGKTDLEVAKKTAELIEILRELEKEFEVLK